MIFYKLVVLSCAIITQCGSANVNLLYGAGTAATPPNLDRGLFPRSYLALSPRSQVGNTPAIYNQKLETTTPKISNHYAWKDIEQQQRTGINWGGTTDRDLFSHSSPTYRGNRNSQRDSDEDYDGSNSYGQRDGMLNRRNVSDMYCMPEVFHHSYIINVNRTIPITNIWKRALVNESVGLHKVCLKANGLPLTRKCLYNHMNGMAEWENVSRWTHVECFREANEYIISAKLNTLHDEILDGKRLHKGVQGRREVTELVCSMLSEPDYKLLPADVHLTSKILREVANEAKDPELSQDIVRICGTFMTGDPQVLRISAGVNATNTLLETFETYMDALSETLVSRKRCGGQLTSHLTAKPSSKYSSSGSGGSRGGYGSYGQQSVETIDLSHKGVHVQLSPNISVFHVNPTCANISGIAIYAKSREVSSALLRESHGHFYYRFIYMNESAREIMKETGLQVATFVPTHLWQHLENHFRSLRREALIVLKVYSHDALFVDPSLVQTRKPFSKILSISIPGYSAQFPEDLPFMLRNELQHTLPSNQVLLLGTGCGYWDYNTWISSGVQTISPISMHEGLILCGTKHLTQFSYLLGGSYRQNDPSDDILITPMHLKVLDIISLVGCSLSLLGLCGIWLTAALFKSWRALASTKVLLNLCVALSLQMIIFVFVNTDDMSEQLVEHRVYVNCVALGALLQYSLLVLFMWMLIVALLQFQRYVTVIGIERPSHYILKSAILAWGFPLIPTLLVACIDPESYIPTQHQLRTDTGICYPSGYGLAFGVILPISLIVIANLTIFIHVFYSISHSLNQTLQRQEKKMVMKQIRLSILLFFLLGLSWIFGLFAYMRAGILFSYLFCLTATLQGFVLFIYFVILDDLPRNAWMRLYCPSKRPKSEKRATEMQSMSTTSTGVESVSGRP